MNNIKKIIVIILSSVVIISLLSLSIKPVSTYEYKVNITQLDTSSSIVMIPAPHNWFTLLDDYTIEEGAPTNINLTMIDGIPWLSIESEGSCKLLFSHKMKDGNIQVWDTDLNNGTTKVYSELINGEYVNLAVAFMDGRTKVSTDFGCVLLGGWEWVDTGGSMP